MPASRHCSNRPPCTLLRHRQWCRSIRSRLLPDGRRSPGQRTAISARGEQLRSRSTNMPRTASRFVPAAGRTKTLQTHPPPDHEDIPMRLSRSLPSRRSIVTTVPHAKSTLSRSCPTPCRSHPGPPCRGPLQLVPLRPGPLAFAGAADPRRQPDTEISVGGLVDASGRMAAALLPWYEQLGEELRASAWLNADETGWRVNGRPTGSGASAIPMAATT